MCILWGINYDGGRIMGYSLGHSDTMRINQIKKNFQKKKKNFQCTKIIHDNLLNYKYILTYIRIFYKL